jgi:hypothetical protein
MQKARALITKPAAVVVLLALLGVTAHAGAILIFTNRDAFQAYVGPPDFAFNFDDLQSTRASIINFGVMTVGSEDLRVADGSLQFLANPSTNVVYNFSSDIFAWGADITPMGGPGQVDFLAGGLSGLINISSPTFVGFASDTPLRAFNINLTALDPSNGGPIITNTPSVNFVIDNVIGNTVPEPTTLLLLASGAGLVGWAQRRRRRARNSQHQPDGE